ncbi:hypothetical protein K438DRAFT_211737 [Mycena galopus ATCC 62051]|nr:hypothetical protein K438DRAFT_211737 [Mycena galopus ATCC 62051]
MRRPLRARLFRTVDEADGCTTTKTALQMQRPLPQDDDSSRDCVRPRIGYVGRPVQLLPETLAHHHRAAYAGRPRASPSGRAQRCAWRLHSPPPPTRARAGIRRRGRQKRDEGRHACPASPQRNQYALRGAASARVPATASASSGVRASAETAARGPIPTAVLRPRLGKRCYPPQMSSIPVTMSTRPKAAPATTPTSAGIRPAAWTRPRAPSARVPVPACFGYCASTGI